MSPEENTKIYNERREEIPRYGFYIYFLHFITEEIYVEFFCERYAIHFIHICVNAYIFTYIYISSYRTNVS